MALRELALSVVDWCDQSIIGAVRRRPVAGAAVVSGIFGVLVFGWQGYREGYVLSVTVLAMGLGFCGMFAFLVPVGSYFRLMRSTHPSHGMRRCAIDACVAGCAFAIVMLAFRGSLWGIIGTNSNAAGPGQFAVLDGGALVLAFAAVLAVETLMRDYTASDLIDRRSGSATTRQP